MRQQLEADKFYWWPRVLAQDSSWGLSQCSKNSDTNGIQGRISWFGDKFCKLPRFDCRQGTENQRV